MIGVFEKLINNMKVSTITKAAEMTNEIIKMIENEWEWLIIIFIGT